MSILIDLERMVVLYKHTNATVLYNLMHIELSHSAAAVLDETNADHWSDYTDLDLKTLYEHTCGQKLQSYSRPAILKSVMEQTALLPESKVNIYEAYMQATSIKDGDDGFYKYAPGSMTPSTQEELFNASAMVTAPGYVPPFRRWPFITSAAPVNTLGAQGNALVAGETPANLVARTPRVPREAGASTRPKPGSKTGDVWDICDSVYTPGMDIKAARKLIVAACEAKGINGSTASVQFGAWRAATLA